MDIKVTAFSMKPDCQFSAGSIALPCAMQLTSMTAGVDVSEESYQVFLERFLKMVNQAIGGNAATLKGSIALSDNASFTLVLAYGSYERTLGLISETMKKAMGK